MKYTYENKTSTRITVFHGNTGFFVNPGERCVINGKVEINGLVQIEEQKDTQKEKVSKQDIKQEAD